MTVASRADGSAQGLTARRIAELFRPYRGTLVVVGFLILVSSGLSVVTPFLTEAVFDRALFGPGGVDVGLLWRLVAAMVAVSLAVAALGVWQTWLTQRVGNGVMRDLRDRLFAHLQRMELAFFTRTRTGEIQSRLDNDVGGVQGVVTDTASTILSNVVTVAAALVAMVALSWRLTIVAVALLPLFVVLQVRVGRVRRRIAKATQESQADLSAITQESLSVSGVLLSKVFDRQRTETARYRAENARQADLQVRQTMTGQSFFALVQAFFGLTPALVYLVAGLSIAGVILADPGGTLTAGTVVAFTTLQNRLLFPIVRLLQVGVEVSSSVALFDRIFAYLDLRPAIIDADVAVELDPARVRGRVTFEDVWFRYPVSSVADDASSRSSDDDGWTLQGITFDVRPGQLVALVGPSGAGKTTTTYLVPRLFDVQRGRVCLDGHDVRDVTLASLAAAVGMVTQETYLFHATIRENLRYAREDATDEEIERACRAANIHDRIMRFPDGYETLVGERGYRLSGGEQQRLAIARVIISDPRVLVLDEATSALDSESERLVQRALQPLMADRTTIAIAHRLSTVLAADEILVFDEGRVVERGRHATLLEAGGLYARLYAEQFGGGEVEARCEDGVRFRDGGMLHHGHRHGEHNGPSGSDGDDGQAVARPVTRSMP